MSQPCYVQKYDGHPHAPRGGLLQQLTHGGSPELVVERALERLAAEQPLYANEMTPNEAVERIRQLRQGVTLGDISIKDLINEGRKY